MHSVYTTKKEPTAMIFAHCRDGVSHNPAEYARPEEYVPGPPLSSDIFWLDSMADNSYSCAAAAETMLGAYLQYDDIIRRKNETA